MLFYASIMQVIAVFVGMLIYCIYLPNYIYMINCINKTKCHIYFGVGAGNMLLFYLCLCQVTL